MKFDNKFFMIPIVLLIIVWMVAMPKSQVAQNLVVYDPCEKCGEPPVPFHMMQYTSAVEIIVAIEEWHRCMAQSSVPKSYAYWFKYCYEAPAETKSYISDTTIYIEEDSL